LATELGRFSQDAVTLGDAKRHHDLLLRILNCGVASSPELAIVGARFGHLAFVADLEAPLVTEREREEEEEEAM